MNKFGLFVLLVLTLGLGNSCKEAKENKSVSDITTSITETRVYLESPDVFKLSLGKESQPQLIDVRTIEEFNEGRIANSQNIPVTDDGFRDEILKLNKDKAVFLYCRSGGRSGRATKILSELGFSEIYDLDGGITAWLEAGYPILQ